MTDKPYMSLRPVGDLTKLMTESDSIPMKDSLYARFKASKHMLIRKVGSQNVLFNAKTNRDYLTTKRTISYDSRVGMYQIGHTLYKFRAIIVYIPHEYRIPYGYNPYGKFGDEIIYESRNHRKLFKSYNVMTGKKFKFSATGPLVHKFTSIENHERYFVVQCVFSGVVIGVFKKSKNTHIMFDDKYIYFGRPGKMGHCYELVRHTSDGNVIESPHSPIIVEKPKPSKVEISSSECDFPINNSDTACSDESESTNLANNQTTCYVSKEY